MLEAHKVLRRILAHAKDHRQDWCKHSEISMFRVDVGRCLKPEVTIRIWLTSHTGRLSGFGHDEKEKRERAADNKHARAFVLSVLGEFKVKATRDKESPENLRAALADKITLDFYGFPTAVTYKCEKQCVAVLPGGKEIPIADVPLEV